MNATIAANARAYRNEIRHSMRFRRVGDNLVAELKIRTRAGFSRVFRASINLPVLRDALLEREDTGAVGFSLKSLWKKTKKIAKKVTRSKVWKVAESTLRKAGPVVPPPYGPAMMAAGESMRVTRGLVHARELAKGGAADRYKARRIAHAAARVAMAHPSRNKRMAASRALLQAPKLYLTLSPGLAA